MITQQSDHSNAKDARDAALYRARRDFEADRYAVQCGDAPDEFLLGRYDQYLAECEVIMSRYAARPLVAATVAGREQRFCKHIAAYYIALVSSAR